MRAVGLQNAEFWTFVIFVVGFIPVLGGAVAGLAPPLFAAALFTLIVALLAFAFQPGFLVGGGDGVDARADHRAGGLGRAADHGRRASDDRADEAALKHQGRSEDKRQGGGAARQASGHGGVSG